MLVKWWGTHLARRDAGDAEARKIVGVDGNKGEVGLSSIIVSFAKARREGRHGTGLMVKLVPLKARESTACGCTREPHSSFD